MRVRQLKTECADEPKLHLELLPTPDDAKVDSDEFQTELRGVSNSFRDQGIRFFQLEQIFKAAGAKGYPLPEFLIRVDAPAIDALAAISGAWASQRHGRKVRLRVGDIEVEGETVEDIHRLLQMALEFQA